MLKQNLAKTEDTAWLGCLVRQLAMNWNGPILQLSGPTQGTGSDNQTQQLRDITQVAYVMLPPYSDRSERMSRV